MKMDDQVVNNISHTIFFMGGVIALYTEHTNLLLFVIIAILLFRFN